jgi:hypothetical protein
MRGVTPFFSRNLCATKQCEQRLPFGWRFVARIIAPEQSCLTHIPVLKSAAAIIPSLSLQILSNMKDERHS